MSNAHVLIMWNFFLHPLYFLLVWTCIFFGWEGGGVISLCNIQFGSLKIAFLTAVLSNWINKDCIFWDMNFVACLSVIGSPISSVFPDSANILPVFILSLHQHCTHLECELHFFLLRVSPSLDTLGVRTGRWRWAGTRDWPRPCLRTALHWTISWSEPYSSTALTSVWGPETYSVRRMKCSPMEKSLKRY